MIHTQFQHKITMVRSTEFLNSSCLDFFSANGIIHQKSIVGTPLQNGVAERKHRHLFDSARAIRIHAGLPKYFFGGNASLQPHALLTSFLWEILTGKPPLKDCIKKGLPMMT